MVSIDLSHSTLKYKQTAVQDSYFLISNFFSFGRVRCGGIIIIIIITFALNFPLLLLGVCDLLVKPTRTFIPLETLPVPTVLKSLL